MLVIDTNLWVSYALFRKGAAGKKLHQILLGHRYAFSDETFRELTEVLMRSKFDAYVSTESRIAILREIAAGAEWFKPTETITDCRDPKDNMFLELAVAASATHIITGDEDLLVLHPCRDIQIVNIGDLA